MQKKTLYKLHRACSLIIALPVLLWAGSGFMHPVMTNIRPQIATQAYTPPPIDTAQMKTSLQDALRLNAVDSIHNVRIVHMGGQQFYQVSLQPGNGDLRYFSTLTGKLLKKGDDLYARFLARYFLEGPAEKTAATAEPEMVSMGMDHDCCMMATMSILNDSKGASILSVERKDRFTGEYKYINRVLPAYRVAFDRGDGIRIYVETGGDRFGLAVDKNRAVFDRLFGWFHTWEWMNGLGDTRYFIMGAITLLGFVTTLLGLYIFFTTKTKKAGNPLVKARRNHRYVSLVASLFTLLFTFSGGYHALSKIGTKNDPQQQITQSYIHPSLNMQRIFLATGYSAIQNVSPVSMKDTTYWRVVAAGKEKGFHATDLMKNGAIAASPVAYIDASDYAMLPGGDKTYARYLATVFSGRPASDIHVATMITKFTEEYGFVNKRLPVWRLSYGDGGTDDYYVETGSGVLAARVAGKDIAEGYSFALFHKHHYMDFAGKMPRDISTMIAALLQVAMVVVGLILWRKSRRRRRSI